MVGFSMKIKKDEIQKKKTGAFSLNKNRVMVPKKVIMSNNADDEDDDKEFKKISIQTSEDLKPDTPKEVIIPLQLNKSLISLRKFGNELTTPSNTNTTDKLSFGLNILEPISTTGTTTTTTTTAATADDDDDDTTNLPNDESQKQQTLTDQARASLLSNEDIHATTIPRNNGKVRALALSLSLGGNDHHDDADGEDDDEPNYSKISVDDFGLLFLKGLGYKPDQETRAKDVAEQDKKRRKKYGNQIGLGSK